MWKGNVTSSFIIQTVDSKDFAIKLESKGIRHKDKTQFYFNCMNMITTFLT